MKHMNTPDNLRYSGHDEWVRLEGDVAVVGITDFAQDQLGELVHVELPDVGTVVAAGDEVCEVESVKAVAEVYSPVGGEVVEVNEALEDGAEQINEEPYEAWLFKLKMGDASGLDALMSADDYRAKISS